MTKAIPRPELSSWLDVLNEFEFKEGQGTLPDFVYSRFDSHLHITLHQDGISIRSMKSSIRSMKSLRRMRNQPRTPDELASYLIIMGVLDS